MSNFVKLGEETIASRLPGILIKRQPKSSQLYNLVQYHLKGITRKVDCPMEFYWYTGLDPEETCIAGKLFRKYHKDVQWIILAPTTQEQEVMLTFSKLLNWDQDMSFNSVDVTILPYIRELCQAHGGVFIGDGLVYDMQMEDALQLNVTDEEMGSGGIKIKPLESDQIPTVLKHWKYVCHNEGAAVMHDALNIPSAGLHLNGKLISWGYTSIDGGIHAVHTLEEYRGHGYARMLLKYMCNKLAATGLIPVVHIEADNDISVKTMKRIGFKYSHTMAWTIYSPPSHHNNM